MYSFLNREIQILIIDNKYVNEFDTNGTKGMKSDWGRNQSAPNDNNNGDHKKLTPLYIIYVYTNYFFICLLTKTIAKMSKHHVI